MRNRIIVGSAMAVLCWLSLPGWAVEYRLQVTNIDRLNFSASLDPIPADPGGTETMRELEARLDHMEFSSAAVLPGREVHVLEDPRYGGQIPARLAFLPATGQQAWTTVIWEGTPGGRMAFEVKSEMNAWQEVWDVATNGTGVLRRASLGGPSLFGGHTRQVPVVAKEFLANAVDQGTFLPWVQQHAKPLGDMYVVVGRRNETFNSADRVYLLLTQPSEPHTYKVVIGWKDYDDRGTGQERFETMSGHPFGGRR